MIKFEEAELTLVADTKISINGESAEKILKLVENLEDNDDVQNVYGNYEISDEEMQRIYGEE